MSPAMLQASSLCVSAALSGAASRPGRLASQGHQGKRAVAQPLAASAVTEAAPPAPSRRRPAPSTPRGAVADVAAAEAAASSWRGRVYGRRGGRVRSRWTESCLSGWMART
ncbi:hypothetical protein EE612_005691 [Oryza sativa]|nr:hypothetical protein EE612_005691 [Oryza sativa]